MDELWVQAKRDLEESGFSLILRPSAESLLPLAELFGQPRPSRTGGPLVDMLKPTPAEEAAPRSLSARYGLGAFPFHTDGSAERLPPRYILLRLAPGIEGSGRPTTLVDSKRLPFTPQDLAALMREIWFVNGGRGRFLSPVLNTSLVANHEVLRFDLDCMIPALAHFTTTAERLQETCASADQVDIHWEPGIVLAFDNWRVLHARRTGSEQHASEERVLERVSIHDRN